MVQSASDQVPGPGPSALRQDVNVLRAERDRFLGLAFAAADLLLETDEAGVIAFASGAAATLLGRSSQALPGQRIFDLVLSDQIVPLNRLFQAAARGLRPQPTVFHFIQDARPLIVSAGTLPDQPGRVFITLRAPAPARDGDGTRLLDARSFARTAEATLRQRKAEGRNVQLSVIEAGGFGALEGKLGRAVSSELMAEIGGILSQRSIDGGLAGRLAGDRFGILHERPVDLEGMRREMDAVLRRSDPEGALVNISAATLDMLGEGAEGEAGVIALRYAINVVSSTRQSLSLADLSQRSQGLLRGAMDRILELKTIIAASRFDIAYQPIVDLATRHVHHHEALLRFSDGIGPAERIAFAETTGLISDLDLAVVHRVLARSAQAKLRGRAKTVSINLSGRSIEQPRFLEALHKLIASYGFLDGLVMFEITESSQITDLDAAARAIATLRATGCPVCLDDFGAGASAFHYLRALPVDYVKIDGAYVREVLNVPRDQLFLAAMARLCTDLGVATIGEMVEDEGTARFLIDLGVRYGQGFLFGRPAPGPA